jgi:hypothetical protein
MEWSGCAMLRAIIEIKAPATSLADKPQLGALGVTSVRTRWEDRTSISSHPLADLGGVSTRTQLVAIDHAA